MSDNNQLEPISEQEKLTWNAPKFVKLDEENGKGAEGKTFNSPGEAGPSCAPS